MVLGRWCLAVKHLDSDKEAIQGGPVQLELVHGPNIMQQFNKQRDDLGAGVVVGQQRVEWTSGMTSNESICLCPEAAASRKQ